MSSIVGMNTEKPGKHRQREERRRDTRILKRSPAKHAAMVQRHLARVLRRIMVDAQRPEAVFRDLDVFMKPEVRNAIKVLVEQISTKLDDMPDSMYTRDAIVEWDQIEEALQKTKAK